MMMIETIWINENKMIEKKKKPSRKRILKETAQTEWPFTFSFGFNFSDFSSVYLPYFINV